MAKTPNKDAKVYEGGRADRNRSNEYGVTKKTHTALPHLNLNKSEKQLAEQIKDLSWLHLNPGNPRVVHKAGSNEVILSTSRAYTDLSVPGIKLGNNQSELIINPTELLAFINSEEAIALKDKANTHHKSLPLDTQQPGILAHSNRLEGLDQLVLVAVFSRLKGELEELSRQTKEQVPVRQVETSEVRAQKPPEVEIT